MLKLPFLDKNVVDTSKFLSVNINAKDVRCLAFYYDGENFKIIGSGKIDLPENAVRNGVALDKDVVAQALREAVEKTTENLGEGINRVLLGLDGGETLGLTTTVRMKRSTKGPIKKEEIDELYSKIMEASHIQARNKIWQTTGNPDIDLEIITTSDIYMKVDEQNVAVLEGQHGETIEFAVYNSFAQSSHIRSLQKVIKKAGLKIIAAGSQMYSLVEWLKLPPKNSYDFVLINIAEDSTDVGVIFGGGIISTKTLNIGCVHFIEALATKMGLSKKEAENILSMYNIKKLASSETAIVKECLSDTIRVWVDGLLLLFEDFSGVKTFAPKIFLSGCGADTLDIMEIIKNEDWTKTIPFKSTPEFSKIMLSDMERVVDSTDKIKSNDWLYTCSMSIIYKEIYESSV